MTMCPAESPRRRKWGPSDATAAAAGLSASHVRIFVPEISKKYNYDLVQAALGLGATGSLYVVRFLLLSPPMRSRIMYL